MNIRFAVSVKHNDGCKGGLWQNNTYVTKFASYKVGIGCQDDAIFTILEFEKLYPQQTQYTLQTNGRIASVGVFPEHGYNKANGSFDLNTRIFYNSFDDAPSSFTLDISDPQKWGAAGRHPCQCPSLHLLLRSSPWYALLIQQQGFCPEIYGIHNLPQ